MAHASVINNPAGAAPAAKSETPEHSSSVANRDARGIWLWALAQGSGALLGYAIASGDIGWLLPAALVLALSVFGLLAQRRTERRFLEALGAFADALAGGDLTRRLDPADDPSHGRLSEQFNAMAHALGRVFIELSRTVHELSSVAHETSSNAVGGDEGVRAQRDVTQSSAAALEELTAGLAVASDNARGMADVASETRGLVAHGGERVAQLAATLDALAAMVDVAATRATGLGDRSHEIGGIADLIADIANRTKLLALNAAIEAQRAGVHGMGFGVVADEVRKLSERTSEATREIAERIRAIRDDVSALHAAMDGVRVGSARSGEDSAVAVGALREVATLAETTQRLAGETADAAAEQSAACQSIARDIESVARLADSNERLTHDNSELSRYLDQLARQLSVAIQHFRYE